MTSASTTIRVSQAQRARLKGLAEQRSTSMADTLDAALEALHRDEFYRAMAEAERQLQNDDDAWNEYERERDQWLNANLT